MCLEIYELDPDRFLGLEWYAALKKNKVKFDHLTDIDMILMREKGIRSEIYYSVYQYGKATNTHLKDYDRNKELSYIQYWDANHLYG